MKRKSPRGSRIAIIHNGSSLFTGDAGQGESNIRRWVIENDWLEAIVALPLNIFYNTGIATYIWVLTNRKPAERKGKVQLIDATQWFKPLRKNLGNKNCELSEEDIDRVVETFGRFATSEQSEIFDNAALGYWKVTVERPLRLRSQCSRALVEELRFASGDMALRGELYDVFGERLFEDFDSVRGAVEERLARASSNETDQDEDGADEPESKPVVPAAARKRLLDERRWQRDQRLYDVGNRLRVALGDQDFDD
jgi:type I restriction enzyme M protein